MDLGGLKERESAPEGSISPLASILETILVLRLCLFLRYSNKTVYLTAMIILLQCCIKMAKFLVFGKLKFLGIEHLGLARALFSLT